MAEASYVVSVGPREVRVWHRDSEDQVRVDFGAVTVFLTPDDAYEIGAELLRVAREAPWHAVTS